MATFQDKTNIKRISRRRKELLSLYATAAGFLYGVIGISDFVDVFNNYEEEKTSQEEVILALKRLAKTDEVEYSCFDDCIYGPHFLPKYPDDLEDARYVREQQKGKPRYMPDKEEFFLYLEPGYREPEKPYADLKAYILKHKLTEDTGILGVDGDLMELHEMTQNGDKLTAVLEYFTDRGYRFSDINSVNSFMKVVTNTHNNTRMYENNGFTPKEIFEQFERPKLQPLPVKPFPKVGRNEPCPCGSGLKYKKCHGK